MKEIEQTRRRQQRNSKKVKHASEKMETQMENKRNRNIGIKGRDGRE